MHTHNTTPTRLRFLATRTAHAMLATLVVASLACPLPGDPDPSGTTGPAMSGATSTGLSAEETGAPVTTGDEAGGTTDVPSTDGATTLGGTDATTASDTAGETSGDATTGAPLCMPGPGEALGPCRPTRDDQCDPDLLCLTTPDGSICQPTCADCSAGEHDACIADLGDDGFTCEAGQGCLLPCEDDAGCHGGTVCGLYAESGPVKVQFCVWPRPETPPDPACMNLAAARCPTEASTFCWAVVDEMQWMGSGGLAETLNLCEGGEASACEVCDHARQQCEGSFISPMECADLESTCLCLAAAFAAPCLAASAPLRPPTFRRTRSPCSPIRRR